LDKIGLRKEKAVFPEEGGDLSGKTVKGEKQYEEQQPDQYSSGS
jgi:hypothetical protein